MPVLTLQPLVENAVKHGIQPKMGPGVIRISAKLVDGEMLFVITDDGVGIDNERLPMVFLPGFGSDSGVGLSNVNERLKSLYGEEYGLRIESEIDKGTKVYVRIPLGGESHEKGGIASEIESINYR